NGYHFYNMYNHGEWYDILVRATGTHGGTANDNYHFGIFRYDSDGGYQPETGNGLDNISNSNKSVIAYAISCDLLQLDESGGNRCFGDIFTILQNSGGVAFLGNTNVGWVSYSKELHKKFVNRLYDNNVFHLGQAEALSKYLY